MRILLHFTSYLALLALALALAITSAASAADKASLAQLSWLAGSWASDSGGTRAEEHWMAPAGGMMVGMSRTVRQRGRASLEFFRIVEDTLGVAYLASPGGRPPTRFGLVDLEARSVVFENPEHDFPQRILYWLDDRGRLHARVEGKVRGRIESENDRWSKASLEARTD